MKLEGNINTIPLRELIEMISYSSVTGALNIYTASSAGHLYFRDGHLYHCDAGAVIGIDALASMFELSEARFSFVSDITSDQESLWGDLDYHMQTAERLAYRWKNIRSSITSLDLLPVLIVPLDTAMRRVGPSHHEVLEQVDGQHTIKAITEDLGWAEIDVAEAIAKMVHDALADLRGDAQEPELAPSSVARGGLFNRLLSRPGDAPRQPAVERPTLSSEEMVLRVLRS
ncbi:DUF4388 domain-containing protein [Chloroflexales bacterium ZM16-3]|nr:DUF4388 domain-containing protein [Chloroflexales bacterium ZM16-3]